jgi:hypothetical protein
MNARIGLHGAARLPLVEVDSYSMELKADDGFIGDRANKGAFQAILDTWRKPLKKAGDDPFGDQSSENISKKALDKLLVSNDVEAAAVLHSAVEEFAQELAGVIRRFLKLKAWADTEYIVVGGGFREGRFGRLAIARTRIILKAEGNKVDIRPIRFHPDEAGLLGSLHLVPSWMFNSHDGILAIDIGGSNIRCGVVETRQGKATDLSKACVWKSTLWRHADREVSRNEAVKKLIKMLKQLITEAEAERLRIAPFIGVACPGVIAVDGTIEKGAQNLPGNWESSRFNLPQAIAESIPNIAGNDTSVLVHNDAVVQGLSEVTFMRDFRHWGILTVGTGLGNARFTNRKDAAEEKDVAS